MGKKHYAIVVPGLGDETWKIRLITNHWKRYGLEPVIHNIWWKSGEKHFEPKLKKLINLIDRLSRSGRVSLVGASAGGSAVLNAFIRRKDKIGRVVTVCSMLRRGTERGFRSFETRSASSSAFRESLLMLEKEEPKITRGDRKKIMAIRALFDELVPGNTAYVKGATNKQIKSVEHVFSIWMALSFYKPLIDFLRE